MGSNVAVEIVRAVVRLASSRRIWGWRCDGTEVDLEMTVPPELKKEIPI